VIHIIVTGPQGKEILNGGEIVGLKMDSHKRGEQHLQRQKELNPRRGLEIARDTHGKITGDNFCWEKKKRTLSETACRIKGLTYYKNGE